MNQVRRRRFLIAAGALLASPLARAQAGRAYRSLSGTFRQSASHAARILKGANPAVIPIEQPTVFELVINMKTARALGLKIPQLILLRADRVIE